MARLRVTATMRKALDKTRDVCGKVQRGGAMVIPKMLRAEAWQELAAPSQDNLIAHARDGSEVQPPVVTVDEDPQVKHEPLYQQYRKESQENVRPYLQHKADEVKRRTAPKVVR